MRPYYEVDGITIWYGDAREVLPRLTKVDHVITDPPYEAEAHTLQRRTMRGGRFTSGAAGGSRGVAVLAPLPFEPMWSELRNLIGFHAARLDARWTLTFCQIEAAPLWRTSYEQEGLKYRRTCIWVKPDAMPQLSGDRPGMGYETVLAMYGKGKSRWNGGGRVGVFMCNSKEGAEDARHPTQKPEGLMRLLIGLFTEPGDLILDPFMGSGSTLRAAKDMGRQAIGIELEENYCEVAARRMQQSNFPFDASGFTKPQTML